MSITDSGLTVFAAAAHLLSELALFCFFAFFAYEDFKKKTIPIQMLPFLYLLVCANAFLNHPMAEIVLNSLGALLVFFIFLINARFFHGGGGDTLFFPVLSLQCGLFAGLLLSMAGCGVTSFIYLITHIWRRGTIKANASLPLLPGSFLAYIIFLIWRVLL